MSGRIKFKKAGVGKVATSANVQLAASELSVNNALQVIPYETGNMAKYNKFFNGYRPDNLLFYFYDNPTLDPSINEPSVPDLSFENGYRIFHFTPTTKFTDGYKHNVLGLMYEGKRLKIKTSGTNNWNSSDIVKLPFFYVEDLPLVLQDDQTYTMTKYYGEIAHFNSIEFVKKK